MNSLITYDNLCLNLIINVLNGNIICFIVDKVGIIRYTFKNYNLTL